jgi:hypothetical protein
MLFLKERKINMRRLFYQTKMYDYTSLNECVKHIDYMLSKGWKLKHNEEPLDEDILYRFNISKLDDGTYKYSVEYFKEV